MRESEQKKTGHEADQQSVDPSALDVDRDQTRFTAAGQIPPVQTGEVSPGKSASELAFGGPMTEDLQMREVSGPAKYKSHTDKSVEYIAIANEQGVVLGYIYANDEDDAAGWVPRPEAGPDAHAGAHPWIMKLLDAKKRGLKPSAALDELVRQGTAAGDDAPSHVVGGSRNTATSLTTLREFA